MASKPPSPVLPPLLVLRPEVLELPCQGSASVNMVVSTAFISASYACRFSSLSSTSLAYMTITSIHVSHGDPTQTSDRISR